MTHDVSTIFLEDIFCRNVVIQFFLISAALLVRNFPGKWIGCDYGSRRATYPLDLNLFYSFLEKTKSNVYKTVIGFEVEVYV